MIEEANFDDDFSQYDDDPPDPYPDDPNYSEFLQARAKTEHLARRLFRCQKKQWAHPLESSLPLVGKGASVMGLATEIVKGRLAAHV